MTQKYNVYSLRITNADNSDAANYAVILTNQRGESVKSSANITVQGLFFLSFFVLSHLFFKKYFLSSFFLNFYSRLNFFFSVSFFLFPTFPPFIRSCFVAFYLLFFFSFFIYLIHIYCLSFPFSFILSVSFLLSFVQLLFFKLFCLFLSFLLFLFFLLLFLTFLLPYVTTYPSWNVCLILQTCKIFNHHIDSNQVKSFHRGGSEDHCSSG